MDMGVLAGVKSRASMERRFQQALERTLNGQYDAVIKQLGDPPDMAKLDARFWDSLDGDLRATLTRELERIYLDEAETAAGGFGIGVDWGLVNADAANWARTYGFDLVKDIGDTTRAALREKVPAFFEEARTIGDLRESLAPLFGDTRAQMIAVTETTRASVQGQRGTVDAIQRQGIQMQAVWLTNNDETVCPVCRPLNGVKRGDDGLYHHPNGLSYDMPPAHVNCRCNEAWRIRA